MAPASTNTQPTAPVVDLSELSELSKRRSAASDDCWVCCDGCGKWRALPGTTNMKRLEKRKWYCSMNPDPAHNSCEIAEEDYSTPKPPPSAMDVRLQGFLRGWVTRLKSIDTAEERILKNDTKGKRSRKRKADEIEWIQCCNPNCGKSRAVSPWLDARSITAKGQWFCVMNTWDEAVASCAAAEELP